jgi:hypothetical protein
VFINVLNLGGSIVAEWTYQVSLAVPDDETRLLLMPEGERWTLPRFTLQALYTDLYI